MCGIIGFIGNNPPSIDVFEQSLNTMSHRGPDNLEFKIIDENCILGHARLAIIDLDKRSNQPLSLDDYTIVFNGEIFNFQSLKEELIGDGFNFKTSSDTEVLLNCYLRWGEKCVQKLNGMWAFCIYDKKNNSAFFSRDRFGIKPFRYFIEGNSLFFASESKALMNSGVSEIIICIDPNRRGQKEAIKEKFNLPLVTTYEQATKEYQFDAVYIASPTGTHKDIVIEAARSGKQILCEKSLGSDLIEVQEMVETCKKYDVALFEGFMYQFHTQHQFVRDLILKGEIGEPFHLEAKFGFPPINENDFRYKKSLGGGVVLDAGSYTVHVARKFFGVEPANAFAVLENEGKEVEIRGTALLNFGESRTASLIFGFNNMYQSKYQIWGTKGIVTLERAYALPPDFKPTCILEKQGYREVFTLDACNHFVEEIKYFNANYKVNEVKKDWYNEAINQSKALQSLF